MQFLDVMQEYFRGEKVEAFAFIVPIGMLLVIFGAIALKVERGGFAWGAAIPCFLFGFLLLVTGVGVGFRTSGQIAGIAKSFDEAPAAMVKKELPRMAKVNSNFGVTLAAFGVVVAIGPGLVYGPRTGWALGLGAVLILCGALGLLIDGFASRRAVPYTMALQQLAIQYQEAPVRGR